MKAHEERNTTSEKKQQELESMLNFMIRTSQQQGHGSNSAPPPS
jgi:hypothetical protein